MEAPQPPIMCTDQASRAMPWTGMYSGQGGSHDAFTPLDWPLFDLNGPIVDAVRFPRCAALENVDDEGTCPLR